MQPFTRLRCAGVSVGRQKTRASPWGDTPYVDGGGRFCTQTACVAKPHTLHKRQRPSEKCFQTASLPYCRCGGLFAGFLPVSDAFEVGAGFFAALGGGFFQPDAGLGGILADAEQAGCCRPCPSQGLAGGVALFGRRAQKFHAFGRCPAACRCR